MIPESPQRRQEGFDAALALHRYFMTIMVCCV